MKLKSIYIQGLIILVAALLYIPFLGSVHLFDWDEINFAESAREMMLTGNYLTVQIDFKPFCEKPPLFIWLQVLSMKIFGLNEFAARFPNALGGIFSLWFLFKIGEKLVDTKFALWWIVAFGGSILPFFYFKTGIIDPWFNLFIFAGIYFMYAFLNWDDHKWRNLVLSAVAIGLAVLTKGPVGFLLFALTLFIYFLFHKSRIVFRWAPIIWFTLVFSFVGGSWFLLQIMDGNFQMVKDFISYHIRLFQTQDAGHGGFLLYHFVWILLGVFPVSVFALKSFVGKGNITKNSDFRLLMKILLWVVLILFSLVKTKIVHYSSLAYFPLSFLGASVIYQMIAHKTKFNIWMYVVMGFIGMAYVLAILSMPIIDKFKNKIAASGIVADEFALGNLQASVHWEGWEILISLTLFLGMVSAFYFFRQKKYSRALVCLFAGTIIYTFSTLTYVVPRIEQYTQNAAIDFFKDCSYKDCYVATINYKSYAPYFYGRKQISQNIQAKDTNWLLTGNIDKPAYFIMRNTSQEWFFKTYPGIHKLYEKNGFVIAMRHLQYP